MLTNIGLVEFAKKARDRKDGYVYGTFGQILTKNLLDDKLEQYPAQVGKYLDFIKSHYMSKRVHDCVGLIKAYMWTDKNGNINYNASQDVSANGMYNVARVKGTIYTMPDTPGLCVRYDHHIGVYIGNGKVVEARGTTSGVVETNLDGRGWTHWCECPYILYINENENKMKKGAKGENVRLLQKILNILGKSLDEDGSFGGLTEKAVKEFQESNSIDPIGIIDAATSMALASRLLNKIADYQNEVNKLNTQLSKIKLAYVDFGEFLK